MFNHKLQQLYKYSSTVDYFTLQHLRWAGQKIKWMTDIQIYPRNNEGIDAGHKTKGNPRTPWHDNFQQDAGLLMRKWYAAAKDHDYWRESLNDVEAEYEL